VLAAAALARQGDVSDALRHFGYAMRWHPLGVLAGLGRLALRVVTHVGRRLFRDRDPAVVAWEEPKEYGNAA
jgi:hypothetical protein